MQSEGRRAFLRGRRPPSSSWDVFCNRLRTVVAGAFNVVDVGPDKQAARLVLQQPADAHHARRLCAEFGICMVLEGVSSAAVQDTPVLWVRPGREMAACRRLEAEGNRWFVLPGCLLGELEAAGLSCFSDLPAHLTVAAWLADRSLCNWAAGCTQDSGVVHASALLADGTSVSLGAFGTENRKALDSLRLQQLIPALFSLASSDDARVCSEWRNWPARYRLDALQPAGGRTLNLAHLLLGHGGDLAWLEWVVIDSELVRPAAGMELPLELPGVEQDVYVDDGGMGGMEAGGSGPCDAVTVARAAQDIDAAVKRLFDPENLFPHPGQAF